jgi:uncharacterized LabA/DUF88 family protein
MRTVLIADVHNLYMACNQKYPGNLLNYSGLLEEFTKQGYVFLQKIAFGKVNEDRVQPFATMMKRIGFELVFGNSPHNIEMALRVAEIVNNRAADCIVLGTNYYEAARILKYARQKGVHTIAFGFELPSVFESYADLMQLNETHLRPAATKAQADVKPTDKFERGTGLLIETDSGLVELMPKE